LPLAAKQLCQNRHAHPEHARLGELTRLQRLSRTAQWLAPIDTTPCPYRREYQLLADRIARPQTLSCAYWIDVRQFMRPNQWVVCFAEQPLLIFDRVGKGRSVKMLSDELWLWSRDFEGDRPHAELLRRVARWLMKEPDLEENDLRASIADGRLDIARGSPSDKPAKVEVTLPSGNRSVGGDRREHAPDIKM
jgi:hypothetical protein